MAPAEDEGQAVGAAMRSIEPVKAAPRVTASAPAPPVTVSTLDRVIVLPPAAMVTLSLPPPRSMVRGGVGDGVGEGRADDGLEAGDAVGAVAAGDRAGGEVDGDGAGRGAVVDRVGAGAAVRGVGPALPLMVSLPSSPYSASLSLLPTMESLPSPPWKALVRSEPAARGRRRIGGQDDGVVAVQRIVGPSAM